MVNKNLFRSTSSKLPATNAVNQAGGVAYALSDEAALAQYACTGCLNGTFYATADTQLATVLELANKVSPKYLAQVAIYAREKGLMKDMPALLLAVLSTRDIALTKAAFPRVCNDAKMVKSFVQIIRSGQVGRKSLGSALKRLVQDWLAGRDEEALFKAVVGNDPSLADIIKMVHPKPKNKARANFYKYLIGKDLTDAEMRTLPDNVREYEKFKAKALKGESTEKMEVPDVPFMLLSNLKLTDKQWRGLAENMSWSALRQNLNSLSKHGIFENSPENRTFVRAIAAKLADKELVRKAKAFPFQLFSAYKATQGNANVPQEIANAIQDAMEHSLSNVPEIDGKTFVAVDISGSMGQAATGNRGSATSTVSCLDAAAVMGSALLRRNPNSTEIIPFSDNVVLTDARQDYNYSLGRYENKGGKKIAFNGRDSVITNVEKLRSLPSGGTNCSSVLQHLNAIGTKGATAVIYISDNESWVDSGRPTWYGSNATETMRQWNIFKKNNPNAKLVCIDIQPGRTSQAMDREDVLNVGGFSDSVFSIVDLFLKNELTAAHWAGTIKKIEA